MKFLFIQPLIIETFSFIWYTLLFGAAFWIYVAIFRFFAKEGRIKAAKLFGAPGGELKYATYRRKDADEGLYNFFVNEKWKRKIDYKWVKRFFEVCHWCGYQVLIRKDSDIDIENTSSIIHDYEILEQISKDNAYLLGDTIEKFKEKCNKVMQLEEKLQVKFEL